MFRYGGVEYYMMTTRFNESTIKENQSFRKRANKPCIYGVPLKIKEGIAYRVQMIVIEMLNVAKTHPEFPGKIIGVGIIPNIYSSRSYRIYENHNYNRYVYQSSVYFSANDFKGTYLLDRMEFALFHGTHHQKRCEGITMMPQNVVDAFPTFIEYIFQLWKLKFK